VRRSSQCRAGAAGPETAGLSFEGLQPVCADRRGASGAEVSITDYERKVVYARLDRQLRVAAMVDIVGFDESVDARRLASMRRLARDTLPDAADYGQAVEWAGMRPATPTGVPIIGATAYRNLWLNVGHGALGFTLACGSAQRLARMMG